MIYCILIFSLLFEASFTNIIQTDSILIPLFLLTTLTIIYPYFNNKKLNFIITAVICGLLYDIVMSNSTFINTLSFGISGGLIVLGYDYINYNICSSNVLNILIISFYRIISYILICIIDYVTFNENIFFKGIYSSILINILYGIFIYIIINLLARIFNKKRLE